ncbi:hypothetical protein Bpfe_025522 [Biomphalaria pfeifferi]|uniref:Uncharacterized protein n=1 Tax=Biomphalaria pfeifferi TaxID=112525 RepID=A0AAD8AZ09_BIOPF|nr:hypothetical protein Bpfe_025522 [Biomphalaria pfeifferi]
MNAQEWRHPYCPFPSHLATPLQDISLLRESWCLKIWSRDFCQTQTWTSGRQVIENNKASSLSTSSTVSVIVAATSIHEKKTTNANNCIKKDHTIPDDQSNKSQ